MLREHINKNPRLVMGASATITVIAIVFGILNYAMPGNSNELTERAFFTDDDGKTWFVDSATRETPFEQNGKVVVRAYVYKCGKEPFVNHLERSASTEASTKSESKPAPPRSRPNPPGGVRNVEVKRPGSDKWVSVGDRAAAAVVKPNCDNLRLLEVVMP